MNEWRLEGVVVREPVRQDFGRGTKTELLLEVDESYERDGFKTEKLVRHPVENWGSLLDNLKLGFRIRVSGSVSTRPWEDKRSQQLKYFPSLRATDIEVLEQPEQVTPEFPL